MWAFSLDLGEWDTLQACFHPDATVTVSWYAGPIGGFIERSKAIVAARKPEEHRKHWLGNMRTDIAGTRAVLETDVMILIREYIDGSLFDYTSYARFYDLFEKRDGAWRIREWSCIYDKDRLDPVVPSWDASSAYAPVVLEGPGRGFAFMKLRQGKRGRTIPDTVVIRDSEAERKPRAAAAGTGSPARWPDMPLRIVFMGTPDFAVPTLVEIVGRGHEVAAVYTRAPKPAGRRGLELAPSPVEREARRFGRAGAARPRRCAPRTPQASRAATARMSRSSSPTGSSCRSRSSRPFRSAASTCTRRCCRAGAAPRRSTARSWRAMPRPA